MKCHPITLHGLDAAFGAQKSLVSLINLGGIAVIKTAFMPVFILALIPWYLPRKEFRVTASGIRKVDMPTEGPFRSHLSLPRPLCLSSPAPAMS